jgi:hypothetical protein
MTMMRACVFGLASAAVVVLGAAVATASDDQCRIEKLRAFTQHSACISRATVQGIRKDLVPETIASDVDACGDELSEAFARAETRALDAGRECPTVGDAEAVHEGAVGACCPLCGCE